MRSEVPNPGPQWLGDLGALDRASTGGVQAGQSAFPLSASTMHPLTSTASNADAGTVLELIEQVVTQCASRVPWKYQFEPLSASNSPYCRIARRIVRALGLNPARSESDSSRKRASCSFRVPASASSGSP